MRIFSVYPTMTRLVLAAVAFMALQATLNAQIKIATVDFKKIFDGYYKTTQAGALLEENGADADKVLAGMLEDYKKGQQEYNKLIESANDQAVSSDEREKRRKSADAKVVDLKGIEQSITQFRKEAVTRIEEQKKRMWENIVREIQEAIVAKGKSGNFTFVVDTSAESAYRTPVFVYANNQNDITEEILSQLNAKAPPGALTKESKEDKAIIAPPSKVEKEEKPTVPAKNPAKKK